MLIYRTNGTVAEDFPPNTPHCTYLTNYYFFDKVDGAYDMSHISDTALANGIVHLRNALAASDLEDRTVVLDIEFPIAKWQSDFDFYEEEVKKAISLYRHNFPNLRLGWYGNIMPERNYWAPVDWKSHKKNKDAWKAWKKRCALPLSNRRPSGAYKDHAGLSDMLDFTVASIYTFYQNYNDDWVVYAEQNLKQARRYQKPVHAWLWPQFHGSNNQGVAGQYIGDNFARLQLDTVRDMGVEAATIFAPSGVTPDSYFEIVSEYV